MLAAGTGTIVTISSVNAFLPDPAVIDYSAAKAALANFSQVAVQGGRARGHPRQHGQPGAGRRPTCGSATDGVAATVARPAGGDRRRTSPPGRRGRRRRAASRARGGRRPRAAAASDRAGNVTGADFVIDGGLVQTLGCAARRGAGSGGEGLLAARRGHRRLGADLGQQARRRARTGPRPARSAAARPGGRSGRGLAGAAGSR